MVCYVTLCYVACPHLIFLVCHHALSDELGSVLIEDVWMLGYGLVHAWLCE